MADDHRKQVVEVVCNPAGQLAHGLHLLRLAQLHFQLALLGHVLCHARNPNHNARRIAHRKCTVPNPTYSTIAANDAILQLAGDYPSRPEGYRRLAGDPPDEWHRKRYWVAPARSRRCVPKSSRRRADIKHLCSRPVDGNALRFRAEPPPSACLEYRGRESPR